MLDIISKGGYVIIERLLFYRAMDQTVQACRHSLNNAPADVPQIGRETGIIGKMWDASAKLPSDNREGRQAAVEDAIRSELPALERNLYILTTAATVAPLLGLLGTVLGMIKTFQAASLSGLGNPQMLAEGISEALYNTAGGLLVAIPCIVANNHFRNRVERILNWAESCTGEIVRRAGGRQTGR